MNILVTGANGQLGNEIRLLAPNSENDYYFTDVDELDITNKNAVQNYVLENKIGIIINCAAYTAVEKAEDEPEKADLINHVAVRNLAEIAKEKDIVLVHVSTDYVFGGLGNLPFQESDVVNPLGVYGRTKLAGEIAIKETDCKALIFRTAWLYSSFGNNFVKTIIKLTSTKESVKVVFDQIGSPTYAGDLAKALFDIVESKAYVGNEGIYHYTNEGVISWYDFAIEIAELAGNTKCKIHPCRSSEFPTKVKRPAYSVLDKNKFKKIFNMGIPYWKDSLKNCMRKKIWKS